MNYNWSIKISIFVLLVMLFPINVKANIICNDGTTSPRCADCHRGCCSHHGGCSNNYSSSSKSSKTTNNSSKSSSSSGSSSSSSSSYTSTTTVKKVEPKSSDTSLKEVIIDSEEIKISNEMSYSTKNESAKINITANDSKATVEYDKNVELNIGDNLINIKVTAENGNAKEYKINIVREKILSNNKNIKILVDDEELIFNSFESETIYLSNDKSKLDIKYELEDANAKAEVIGNDNLKVGTNKVIVKVTAENGDEQDYTIMVKKYDKTEENIYSLIALVVFIGLSAGIGYLIYYLVKKTKKV